MPDIFNFYKPCASYRRTADRIPAPICGLEPVAQFSRNSWFCNSPAAWETTLPVVTFTRSSTGSDALVVHDALDEGPKVEQKWEREGEMECSHVQMSVRIDGLCTCVYAYACTYAHTCMSVVGNGRPCPWGGAVRCARGGRVWSEYP